MKTSLNTDNVGSRDDLEFDAMRAEDVVRDVRCRLAEVLPTLLAVRRFFTSHRRGSITFRGCKSWREYCEKRLRCTPDAIFMAKKRLNLKQAAQQIAAAREKRKAEAEARFERDEWDRAAVIIATFYRLRLELQEWKSKVPENFRDESPEAAKMVDRFDELASTLLNFDMRHQVTPRSWREGIGEGAYRDDTIGDAQGRQC